MEICRNLGAASSVWNGNGKVNIGVGCQVSGISRESVYLDCEAKLCFRNWERNYPLSPNFIQLEDTCLRDRNHVHILHIVSVQ